MMHVTDSHNSINILLDLVIRSAFRDWKFTFYISELQLNRQNKSMSWRTRPTVGGKGRGVIAPSYPPPHLHPLAFYNYFGKNAEKYDKAALKG